MVEGCCCFLGHMVRTPREAAAYYHLNLSAVICASGGSGCCIDRPLWYATLMLVTRGFAGEALTV